MAARTRAGSAVHTTLIGKSDRSWIDAAVQKLGGEMVQKINVRKKMHQHQSVDIQTFLNEHPVSWFQWLIFALCFVIVLLDGFDTAAIGFIAPSLIKEWGVTRPELGPVLSAALFGLAVAFLREQRSAGSSPPSLRCWTAFLPQTRRCARVDREGGEIRADLHTAENGRHALGGSLRRSVFGWPAGYEDVK